MKRYLVLSLIFCAVLAGMPGAGYCAEEPRGEIPGSCIPLKLYFYQGYDAGSVEGVLSGDGAIYLIRDDSYAPYSRDPGRRVVKVTVPTPEQWKKLYDLCEMANIWGLGEMSEFLPEEDYELTNVGIVWKLNLEYSGRNLDVEGEEIFVPQHVDVPGSLPQYGKKTIIAQNLIVAKEYPKLQEIFRYLYELAAPPNYSYNMLNED